MKLLFDENLAARLTSKLADLFPGSTHVATAGLDSTPDNTIWDFAKANEYTIITKDKDFENLSLVRQGPPKVIVLQLGNCSVNDIEDHLRRNAIRITDFHQSSKSLLIITR